MKRPDKRVKTKQESNAEAASANIREDTSPRTGNISPLLAEEAHVFHRLAMLHVDYVGYLNQQDELSSDDLEALTELASELSSLTEAVDGFIGRVETAMKEAGDDLEPRVQAMIKSEQLLPHERERILAVIERFHGVRGLVKSWPNESRKALVAERRCIAHDLDELKRSKRPPHGKKTKTQRTRAKEVAPMPPCVLADGYWPVATPVLQIAEPTWTTYVKRLDFEPKRHGFHFPNNFLNAPITIPGFGQVTAHGRCGGMAYAALDYRYAGAPIPAYTSANYQPGTVPPDGHWLAGYLLARQITSFMQPTALNFIKWTLASDHSTWLLGKGVTRWTKEDELPKLRSLISSGSLVVLGLIGANALSEMGKNHQVVAYGYRYNRLTDETIVYIYDCDHPDRETTLSSWPSNPHWNAPDGRIWRGFFIHSFQPNRPPILTMNPPAPTRNVVYGNTVKIGHVLTGRSLHSHALNYTHPGSSEQQQVTAFGGSDDNDNWRLKGPHGQPEGYKAGQPVLHGDIIRLQHAATGRNLHSQRGYPSPVTGQQEVSAFGQNGVGDSDDNWRVEVTDNDTWTAGKRLRLVHVNTGVALHSHFGQSHPDWTAGQQEVTGFGGRDDNDWWLILEIR